MTNIGVWQPEGGRRLSGHPITRGLVMAVNFASQSVDSGASSATVPIPEDTDIAGPGRWLRGNVAYATGINRFGRWVGFSAASSSSMLEWQRSDFVPSSGGVTILFLYEKADATNRASWVSGVNYGLSGVAYAINVHCPYSDGTVYWDFGGNGAPNRCSVGGLTFGADVWIFNVGSRGQEIWQNGIKRASNANNPTRSVDNTMPFILGGGPSGSGQASDIAHYNIYCMWNRQLATEEIIALSADPYMLWGFNSR